MSKRILLPLLIVLFVMVPAIASAQIPGVPIVPQCNGPCQSCDILKGVDNLMKFAVFLATVIATLMLVYAGFLYIGSSVSVSNIEKAHKVFFNVIIGFIIILVAWLIVATLLRTFTQQASYTPWDQITCNISVSYRTVTNPTLGTVPDLSQLPLGSRVNVPGFGDNVLTHPTERGVFCVDETVDSGALNGCNVWSNDPEHKGVGMQKEGSPNVFCQEYDTESEVCTKWNNETGSLYENPNLGTVGAPTSGPCSVDALRPVWGADAATAGCICASESGGGLYDGTGAVRTDVMLLDSQRPGFSFGLFQINTAASPITCSGVTLNCPAAYCNTNTQTCVVNGERKPPNPTACEANVSAYERKLGYAPRTLLRDGGYCHVVNDQNLYNACVAAAVNPSCNSQNAQYIRTVTRGWGPWTTSAKKCGAL